MPSSEEVSQLSLSLNLKNNSEKNIFSGFDWKFEIQFTGFHPGCSHENKRGILLFCLFEIKMRHGADRQSFG